MIKQFGPSILLAIALLAAVFALLPADTNGQGANTTCYQEQGGASVVAGDGCVYTFASGSRIKEQSHTLALSNGSVISSAYGLQLLSLSTAATVTLGLTTTYAAGDRLKLYNPTAYTLTIVDGGTGTPKLSGNIALGQYDWAELWFNGTAWVQTGESDN